MANRLIELAREVIRAHLAGRAYHPENPSLPPQGCFVSLKIQGRLRGCIGTIKPTQPTLEQEVAANAIAAGFRDPRFPPLRPEELSRLSISIDLLSAPEKVDSLDQLDPARYGAIVRAGERSGVLLPDLPGVEDAARQVAICREKGRIPEDEPVTLYRFSVERLKETE